MKKMKLIKNLCLLIAATMILSISLTSCGTSGADVTDVVYRSSATLSIYVPIISGTPEAIAEVEKELSKITESKLTTRIKLFPLPMDEYISTIYKRFEQYDVEQEKLRIEQESIRESEKASKDQSKKDKAAGITAAATKKPTDPPKTTELYTEKIVYENLKENQLDIFLIPSAEMFEEFARLGRLAPMDEELTTKAKILYEYIHPSIMMAGTYNGSTYAISSNRAIGQTTYMALNKRLLEQFNNHAEEFNAKVDSGETDAEKLKVVDITKIRDYSDLVDYLRYVKANAPKVALAEGPVLPDRNYEILFADMPRFALAANAGKSIVYTPPKPYVEPTAKITEPETDENGNLIEQATEEPTIPKETVKPQPSPPVVKTEPDSVSVIDRLKAATMVTTAKLNQQFRDEGLFTQGAVNESQERAVFLRTGTLEDYYSWIATEDQYEYEYIVYDAPRATKKDLQNGMFAISASTINVARAMEVITLLNTNKLFKNTFQYGVEGTHYVYNDEGEIERLGDDYIMEMNYTGNNFIADLMSGENPDKWQIAMEHNLGVINSVFLNKYVDRSKLDESVLKSINTLSEKFYDELITGKFTFPSNLVLPEGVDPASLNYDIDDYVTYVVNPTLTDAGAADLLVSIKEQFAVEE